MNSRTLRFRARVALSNISFHIRIAQPCEAQNPNLPLSSRAPAPARMTCPAWPYCTADRRAVHPEVQRRAAPVLRSGSDAIIASETGSGKTLSFLLPCLANLTYPPDMYLDEMKVR